MWRYKYQIFSRLSASPTAVVFLRISWVVSTESARKYQVVHGAGGKQEWNRWTAINQAPRCDVSDVSRNGTLSWHCRTGERKTAITGGGTPYRKYKISLFNISNLLSATTTSAIIYLLFFLNRWKKSRKKTTTETKRIPSVSCTLCVDAEMFRSVSKR